MNETYMIRMVALLIVVATLLSAGFSALSSRPAVAAPLYGSRTEVQPGVTRFTDPANGNVCYLFGSIGISCVPAPGMFP